QHSLTVLARATTVEPAYGLHEDLVVRLAALLHDIGKPKTRRALPGGQVTFHHHEVVGAAMARDRLTALRFPAAVVADVSRLIARHLRLHGYGGGEWTDSAVRRYVRDAGHLLTRLHVLTRADCTTRNKAKAQRLERAYDDLERRIAVLSEQEELDKIRPDLNGTEIMQILRQPPGPLIGKAYRYLLDERMEHGPLGRDRATQKLLRWAEVEGLDVPGGAGRGGGAATPAPARRDRIPGRDRRDDRRRLAVERHEDRAQQRAHGQRDVEHHVVEGEHPATVSVVHVLLQNGDDADGHALQAQVQREAEPQVAERIEGPTQHGGSHRAGQERQRDDGRLGQPPGGGRDDQRGAAVADRGDRRQHHDVALGHRGARRVEV